MYNGLRTANRHLALRLIEEVEWDATFNGIQKWCFGLWLRYALETGNDDHLGELIVKQIGLSHTRRYDASFVTKKRVLSQRCICRLESEPSKDDVDLLLGNIV